VKKVVSLILLTVVLAFYSSVACGGEKPSVLYCYSDELGPGTNDMVFAAITSLTDHYSCNIAIGSLKNWIAEDDYDLVIVAISSKTSRPYGLGAYFPASTSIGDSGLDEYINNGGKIILCDPWASSFYPLQPDFFKLFGAAFPAVVSTDLAMTVMSPVFADGVNNPVTLSSGATFVGSSMKVDPSSDGEVAATWDNVPYASIITANGGRTIINSFSPDALSDDTLLVNEIKSLLPEADTGSRGCNIGGFLPCGLLLLAPLALLVRKKGK